jgi:hypothetical protein
MPPRSPKKPRKKATAPKKPTPRRPKRSPKLSARDKKAVTPRPVTLAGVKAGPVLLIECDTRKLQAQGITFARELGAITAAVVRGARPVLVRSSSQEALLRRLRNATTLRDTYDVIVLVGHSNIAGIQLFGGPLVSWAALADWLRPFAPRQIVLVACEAGRWLPCRALFAGIPTLVEIFGSPVATSPDEAIAVKLLVPFLAVGGKLEGDAIQRLLQVGNFLLTGGVIFRQTRDQFERTDQSEGLLWTGLEELLRVMVPGIWAAIGS